MIGASRADPTQLGADRPTLGALRGAPARSRQHHEVAVAHWNWSSWGILTAPTVMMIEQFPAAAKPVLPTLLVVVVLGGGGGDSLLWFAP